MKNLNLIITAIPSFPNAVCATVSSPDSWFPENGTTPAEAQLVKRICGSCEHQMDCLKYAIDNEIEYGIWGGLNATERVAIIRRGRKAKKTRPSILPNYDKLLEMRKDGMSARQIGARYNVTVDAVNQAMRRGALRAGDAS